MAIRCQPSFGEAGRILPQIDQSSAKQHQFHYLTVSFRNLLWRVLAEVIDRSKPRSLPFNFFSPA